MGNTGEPVDPLSAVNLGSFPLAITLASPVVVWRPAAAVCAPVPVLPSVVSRGTRWPSIVSGALVSAASPVIVPPVTWYVRIYIASTSWRTTIPWCAVIIPSRWWSGRWAAISLPCWPSLVAEPPAVGTIPAVTLAIETSSGPVRVRAQANSPALGRRRKVGFAVVELSTV